MASGNQLQYRPGPLPRAPYGSIRLRSDKNDYIPHRLCQNIFSHLLLHTSSCGNLQLPVSHRGCHNSQSISTATPKKHHSLLLVYSPPSAITREPPQHTPLCVLKTPMALAPPPALPTTCFSARAAPASVHQPTRPHCPYRPPQATHKIEEACRPSLHIQARVARCPGHRLCQLLLLMRWP